MNNNAYLPYYEGASRGPAMADPNAAAEPFRSLEGTGRVLAQIGDDLNKYGRLREAEAALDRKTQEKANAAYIQMAENTYRENWLAKSAEYSGRKDPVNWRGDAEKWSFNCIDKLVADAPEELRDGLKIKLEGMGQDSLIRVRTMAAHKSRQMEHDAFNAGLDLDVKTGDLDSAVARINGNSSLSPKEKEQYILNTSRLVFDTRIATARESGDWEAYENAVCQAEAAGVCDPAKAGTLRYEGEQVKLGAELSNSISQDPFRTMRDILRGKYRGLDARVLKDVEMECRKLASVKCPIKEFTPEEMAAARNGLPVKPLYEVRNGATKEEHEWREYYNANGTYDRYQYDIEAAWMQEVEAAPVFANEAEATSWIEYMAKKWSDPATGYQVDEFDIRRMAKQKAERLLGLSGTLNQVNERMFCEQLNNETIAPNYTKVVNSRSGRKREEAVSALEKGRLKIENEACKMMAFWREQNPGANYSQECEAMREMLILASRQHDLKPDVSYHSDQFNKWQKQQQEERISDATTGRDLREKRAVQPLRYQKEQYEKYRNNNKAWYPPKSREMNPQLVGISRIEGDDEAVYVPAADYAEIVKRFGERPVALVMLPGTRAYREVPVYLGKGTGVEFTDTLMLRMDNVDADEAMVSFKATPQKEKAANVSATM